MKRARPGACVALLVFSTLFGAGCAESSPTGGTQAGAGGAGGSGGNGGSGLDNAAGAGGTSGLGGEGKHAGGDGMEDIPESKTTFDVNKVCNLNHTPIPFFFSADDSSSMASPALAREWLNAGEAPPPSQIRTHEFLNYYNVLYDPPPATAGELGLHAELVLEDLGEGPTGKFRLQVGVQAFKLPRPPLVVTFVMDTSGSLVGPGIERARAALLSMGGALVKGDIVNIATWSNDNNVLLEGYIATGTPADGGVMATAVKNMTPGGGSDLHGGLSRGYKLARDHFDADKLNRVVFVSDGGANLGVVDEDIIAGAAAEANGEGIYLLGVGVGPAAAYQDRLMDSVTDAGRGAYVYLDDPSEAMSLFTARFDEVMNVAARDVQVEIDLPPSLEIESFYTEKYSEYITAVDPQNLAPGDSMIFNERLHLIDKVDLCGDDVVKAHVTWETPITHEPRSVELPAVPLSTLLSAAPSPQMIKANAVIAYAEALKVGTPEALGAALKQVQGAVTATGDADLAGIEALIKLHPAMSP